MWRGKLMHIIFHFTAQYYVHAQCRGFALFIMFRYEFLWVMNYCVPHRVGFASACIVLFASRSSQWGSLSDDTLMQHRQNKLKLCNHLRRSLLTLVFRRQIVLHLFLYTASCHRSRPLFILSLHDASFIHVKKGAVLGVVAMLALYSNVLVMYLGTGPTAGHSAMVVVKKERASCEAKSSVCFS